MVEHLSFKQSNVGSNPTILIDLRYFYKESNLNSRLRRSLFYQLNYKSKSEKSL